MSDQPWHELPPGIAGVLRPVLNEIAEEVIEAVRTVPAYARPLEGAFGEGLRGGVEEGSATSWLRSKPEGRFPGRMSTWRWAEVRCAPGEASTRC